MTALIPWRNPRPRTKQAVREVILELTLDDRGFADGMRRARDAIIEQESEFHFLRAIAKERTAGRRYVTDLMDAWRTELGMPLYASRLRRSLPCDCDICTGPGVKRYVFDRWIEAEQ